MGAVANDNELLLLGLLRQQSQHGYQINDFIERNLSRMASLKKATAYALLERLREAGHISAVTVQEGNRPPRQVYTITPSEYLALAPAPELAATAVACAARAN